MARGKVVKAFVVLADKFKHVRGDSEAKERLILELQVRGGKYYFQIMLNKSVACVHSGPGAREGHHGAVQVPEEGGVRGQRQDPQLRIRSLGTRRSRRFRTRQ